MARRIKKGEPEMLIVSFCDIVTITTAAMFFAMLVTVQEAVKIPVYRPTTRVKPINKQAVFFECRQSELFYVDKDDLKDQLDKLLAAHGTDLRSIGTEALLKLLQGRTVSNAHYTVNLTFLLRGNMALEPVTGVHGEKQDVLENNNSAFQTVLHRVSFEKHYFVFLVHDDSFEVFRKARKLADAVGFDVGWEYIGDGEPIQFGSTGVKIGGG
jgi:hypothetical protein